MKSRFLGIILISLFLIQFYTVTSSKEFVCYKSENICQVKKLFYDKQIFDTYDLDRIEKLNWEWKYRRKNPRTQQVYMMYKMTDGKNTDRINLINTDFADDKIAEFNKYLKNNEEKYSFNNLLLYSVILTILTLFFFVPLGVVFLKKDSKFEIR